MDHILRSKLFTHYHRQCAKEEPILLPPRIEQFYTILENEPPLRRSSEKAVNEMEHEGNGPQQQHQHGHHVHHRSRSTSSTTTTSSNGGAERELRAAAAASLDPLSDSASDYNALAAGHNHNTTTTTTTSPPPLHTITTTNVMMNSSNGDGRQNSNNNNNTTMTADDGTTTSSRGDGEGRSHVCGAPDTGTRPATAATTAAVGGVRVVDDPLAFPREDSLNAPLPGAGGNNANSSSSNMSTATMTTTMTLPRALPCPEDSTAGAHTISNNSLTQAGCNNITVTTDSTSNAMHVTGQKVTTVTTATATAGSIVEHRGAQGAPRPHRRPQGELLSLFDQSPEARAELRRRRKEQLRAQINHPEAPVIVQIAAKDRALCTLGTTLTDYVNSVVDLRTQRVQKGLADLTQVGTVVYAGLPTTPYSPSESSTNNNNNNTNANTKSAMSEKERAGGSNEKEKKRKVAKDAAANGHPCYNGLYAKYPSSRKGKKADKQQQQMLLSRQMPLYDAASPVTFEELREHPLLLTRPRRQARWAGVVHGRVPSEEMYGQPVPYHTNNNTAEQESSSNNNNNDAMTGQLIQNTYHHNYYYDARADTTGRMSEAYIAPQPAQGYEGGMRSSSSCAFQGNLTTTTPPLLSSCYYYNSNSTHYYYYNNYGTGTGTGGLYASSEAAAMSPSRQNTNTTTATTPITTTTNTIDAGSTVSSTLMTRMMMSGTTFTTTSYNNNNNNSNNNYTNMAMPSQSMTRVPNTAHSNNNNNGSSNNTPMYVGTVCTAVPTTIGRPIATLAQPPVQTQSNKAAYNTTSTSTSSSNVCNVSGWPQMSTAACSCSWSALTLSTQSLSSAQQPTQTQQQAAAAAATVAGYPALSLQYQSAGQSVAPRPSLTPEGYAVYLSA